MSKKKEKSPGQIKTIDVLGFLSSIVYLQSVLTVAHHTSMWVHDGSTYTVESPSIPTLVFGLALVFYSVYKNRKLTPISLVTLTVLSTSSIFWLSGLRTNFFF